MKKVVIICGGECHVELISRDVFDDAYVIAADSGCDTAEKLGILPDLVIGDFDSAKRLPEGVKIIRALPEKDDTDTMLAIKHALDEGAAEITVIGGGGGRCDHLLSNIFMLEFLSDRNVKAELNDGLNRIFLLHDGEATLKNESGYFGVLALEDSVVTLTGCKYPLHKADLIRSNPFAVSNEVTSEEAKIIVSGKALVVITRE